MAVVLVRVEVQKEKGKGAIHFAWQMEVMEGDAIEKQVAAGG